MDDDRASLVITRISSELGVSHSVAKELALLADWDADLAIRASERSLGLSECKCRIINERLRKAGI